MTVRGDEKTLTSDRSEKKMHKFWEDSIGNRPRERAHAEQLARRKKSKKTIETERSQEHLRRSVSLVTRN